jgi:acyl-CoA reductase-like NAD-dependent aldehyde dehydrogenase
MMNVDDRKSDGSALSLFLLLTGLVGIILSLENGKTLDEAKGEVIYAANFVSWFAEEATRSYGYTIPSPCQTQHWSP